MWVGKGSGTRRGIEEEAKIPGTCDFAIGRVGLCPLSGDGRSPNVVNQSLLSNDTSDCDSDEEE